MSGAFAGERAVVVGLAVAGAAAARVLAEEGASVLVSEARQDIRVPKDLLAMGVEVPRGGHEASHLNGATLMVVSPGISPATWIVELAGERGISVWSELDLGAHFATVPYLGITGTNGKTTTTAMIASCLRKAGLDAVACGNIGRSFPVTAREDHDILVVECSVAQLELHHAFNPRVSVLLNLAPDHLDRHHTYPEYVQTKERILVNQTSGDTHVGNRDDADAARVSRSAPCDVRWFTLGEPGPGETGFVADALVARREGDHDLGRLAVDTPAMRADAAACAAACLALGASPEAIRNGLAGFTPARHRGEVVAEFGGVRFVDNSKATNPHATLAAVGDALGVVLVAGGDAKGVDLSPLAALAGRLSGVVAIGAAADELVGIFDGRVSTRKAGSIEEAVRVAHELVPPHGTVLLAPACASWDMFRDYEERGDRFAAAARALVGEVVT